MVFEDFRLKVFVTVVDEGSFTKAARVLDISQPAVSQNISAGRGCFSHIRQADTVLVQGCR